MTDVEEIIEYIKSLKKGFDKELFQSKIDELAFFVDNEGLDYHYFHTLFKIWLNLSIPIKKWISLGVCLVPRERISERTVDYTFLWLLQNLGNQANLSRLTFVLDWLTAAMDHDCIDMNSLDAGYEIFYSMVSYEGLTPHCLKLVYTLSKPVDVTRRRVLELLEYAKIRDGKKNMLRQIQVLLGLFESYKPECVPETVPFIPVHTFFKKLNVTLVERFKNCQNHLNSAGSSHQKLSWINPINSGFRNKKAYPLVPNLEFVHIGSQQYSDAAPKKTFLDFSDGASVVSSVVGGGLPRPARLRALLCNSAGVTLLALINSDDYAFLSQDLHHQLSQCFLGISPHSYVEKQDLLSRLSTLQITLMEGIPVVTKFLAQYLLFWNEKDFYAEILELVQWLCVDDSELVTSILDSLSKVYCRSQPIEQCAIMKAVTNLYCNLVYASTRREHSFLTGQPLDSDYSQILFLVEAKISNMWDKGLQYNPKDMSVLYSGLACKERRVKAHLRHSVATRLWSFSALSAASLLLAPSAALLDKTASLLLLYKQVIKISNHTYGNSSEYKENKEILKAYTYDIGQCFNGECFTSKGKSLVFKNLHPQLVSKLLDIVPEAGAQLSLRNHLALAPYTYMQWRDIDNFDTDSLLLIENVIEQELPNLSEVLHEI